MGTLNIFKYEGPPDLTQEPDGTALTVSVEPIPGVVFHVEALDYDLTTNDGWVRFAADVALTRGAGTYPFSYVDDQGVAHLALSGDVSEDLAPTDATGWAGADLPFGAYLVTEVSTPAGVVPAGTFIVTIPMTDPADRASWLYDVYAYPKNDVVSATKTVTNLDVSDPNTGATARPGDALRYHLTGDIPLNFSPDGEPAVVSEIKFVDDYDDDQLDLDPASLRVLLHDKTVIPVVAVETIHVVDDYTVTDDGGSLSVELTSAGLAKLNAFLVASANGDVAVNAPALSVSFDATITGSQDIENTFEYWTAAALSLPAESGVVQTQVGNLELTKTDSLTGAPVTGAVFQIFDPADTSFANPLEDMSGVDTYTTGPDGKLFVPGLRFGHYVLVEVQAPAGYELLAEPIHVWVDDSGDVTEAGYNPYADTTDTNVASVLVTNVQARGGISLPFSGGTGTAFFAGLGALIAAGAATVLLIAKRRQTQRSDQGIR